ncbi:lactonase family protein [Flavobacterium sp. MAH-1]|uniref:Lactonase family protein n=1 Tax=Flavobacterium agri TaxID=2743471 RepID=A0A7Y8XZ06_9FLAO|nr:lactonase family protein [Flavobacterium agri]NUY79328.1 lactonase family protein [Flavobacterium agri]NYA69352.1 lactonase family protein [Flavobacterium agri]
MKKIFLLTVALSVMTAQAQKKYNLLVGTYTNSCDSKGIYVFDFNPETADIKQKSSTGKLVSPSFLSVSPDKKFIYAVNEDGKKSSVSALNYSQKSGDILYVNSVDSQGADPCHIVNDDKNVLVANYSGGTISVFKKKNNGAITEAVQVIKHEGHSANAKRQESPHVHMVHFSPDKKFVLSNDLGTDRIYVYRYYPDSEKQVLEFQDTIPIKTSSGPRHLTFSPNGKQVYLLQELDGTISVFNYNDGKLKRIQETTIVQPDFKGDVSGAAIKISSDGKFLYATNRGDANTISVFEIGANGRLTHKSTVATGGKGPRDFALSPDGKFVLIAHQYTNNITVFERDATTGLLTKTGKKIEMCSPVCLVFDEVN